MPKRLFRRDDGVRPVLGQTLMIDGYPYTVIGVLSKKKQNGSYGSGPDNTQLRLRLTDPILETVNDVNRSFTPSEPLFRKAGC